MLLAWTFRRVRDIVDAASPKARVVKPSAWWRDYFRANADDLYDIPWEDGLRITAEELMAIGPSLRAWQLGETSDGANLTRVAKAYAEALDDPEFVEAIACFIAEEQRHGELLGRYLDAAGIERAQSDLGDTLFRKLRYLIPRMEAWATPVIMVETHALIYFNALRNATNCPVLRQVCAQILSDETRHVRFQSERFEILHRDRPRWLRWLTLLGHRVLFLGVTLAIWLGHRKALKSGGYGFARFWRSAWSKMNEAWRNMNPNMAQDAGSS